MYYVLSLAWLRELIHPLTLSLSLTLTPTLSLTLTLTLSQTGDGRQRLRKCVSNAARSGHTIDPKRLTLSLTLRHPDMGIGSLYCPRIE